MTGPGQVTRLQIAKIWASARELGMDSALLHQLVPRGSIRSLSRAEASELIERLVQLGATAERIRGRRSTRARGRGGLPPTHHQRHFIHYLLGKLGWLQDPAHTRNFLLKYFHVESVEAIATRKKAGAVIEALKAIQRRRGAQQALARTP